MSTHYYCAKCDIDMSSDMEHCEDCDVCVSDYDHHCVFFSKCIAGGNIFCFYAAIGMLLLNFFMMAVFVILDANNKTSGSRSYNSRRSHHLENVKMSAKNSKVSLEQEQIQVNNIINVDVKIEGNSSLNLNQMIIDNAKHIEI
jgi:hypothetical protein